MSGPLVVQMDKKAAPRVRAGGAAKRTYARKPKAIVVEAVVAATEPEEAKPTTRSRTTAGTCTPLFSPPFPGECPHGNLEMGRRDCVVCNCRRLKKG